MPTNGRLRPGERKTPKIELRRLTSAFREGKNLTIVTDASLDAARETTRDLTRKTCIRRGSPAESRAVALKKETSKWAAFCQDHSEEESDEMDVKGSRTISGQLSAAVLLD